MVKMNSLPARFRKKAVGEHLDRICEQNDVVFLALFGSFAHGRQTVRSDVDLLVKFDKTKDKSLLDLIRAEREMKKVFHRKVDLVTEKSLSPYLRKSVLKSLRVIYER